MDNVRVILLPHAGPQYSYRACEEAAKQIKKDRFTKALCISTFHNYEKEEDEHSFLWMRESLKNTHLYPLLMSPENVKVYYAKGKSNAKELFNIVYYTVTKHSDTLIIFNTDLTHYGKHYNSINEGAVLIVKEELKKKWESPLLNALTNGTSVTKALNEMKYKPCGLEALKILSKITRLFNYEGRVVSYYDSLDVQYWDSSSSSSFLGVKDSFVSYVAMCFKPRSYRPNFVYDLCKRFKNFSECNNEWVFLSLVNEDRSFACLGRIDDTRPICEKLADIVENNDYNIIDDLKSG